MIVKNVMSVGFRVSNQEGEPQAGSHYCQNSGYNNDDARADAKPLPEAGAFFVDGFTR